MWPLEHLIFLTGLAALTVVIFAGVGLYLSITALRNYRVAVQVVTVTTTMAVSFIFSVGIGQLWGARRDRDERVWAARSRHLGQLQALLRTEAESLKAIAQALRVGRYLTQVANDARQAVWEDDTLTSDVERHFPEYYREREKLIREILEHDSMLGRIRQVVSSSLPLTEATEPYRWEVVPALVRKCGGAAPGVSFAHLADSSRPAPDAAQIFDRYRCAVDLTRMCQALLDRAADLADAALQASEAARRYAEETVLHGSCTYVPAEEYR
jgi:hypothetical protein